MDKKGLKLNFNLKLQKYDPTISTFFTILNFSYFRLSAYLVNYTSFWIIGNTSIITYAVFSKLKLCATILSGPYIFGDELNFQQIQGILLTLVGVFYYTYVKLHEKAKLPVVLPTSRRNSGQANKSMKLKTRLASSVSAK